MPEVEYNLADLWEKVADTVGDREAMVCGERRLTFAVAEERANRLAHALAARGVGPGDHVALYLYNGTEYIEGMLAAFNLSAVPINVNYRYRAGELEHLYDDADLVALVELGVRQPARRCVDRRPVADDVDDELEQLGEVEAH